MKKYQLWLERKSYSQHLANLITIKSTISSPTKKQTHRKNRKSEATTPDDTSKLGDVSYPILNRQLREKNLRILKSFQLHAENRSMARRMRDVRSVVGIQMQKKAAQLGKRRAKQQKYQRISDDLRQTKYKRYVHWQSCSLPFRYSHMLELQILTLSKHIVEGQFSTLWCQIPSGRSSLRSHLIDLGGDNWAYRFIMQHQLEKQFVLNVFLSKGLDSELVGSFLINRPEYGNYQSQWYKSSDNRNDIELRMNYFKNNKSRPLIGNS